jgi:hypothetical protein
MQSQRSMFVEGEKVFFYCFRAIIISCVFFLVILISFQKYPLGVKIILNRISNRRQGYEYLSNHEFKIDRC